MVSLTLFTSFCLLLFFGADELLGKWSTSSSAMWSLSVLSDFLLTFLMILACSVWMKKWSIRYGSWVAGCNQVWGDFCWKKVEMECSLSWGRVSSISSPLCWLCLLNLCGPITLVSGQMEC